MLPHAEGCGGRPRRARGFTLVELMIVVALIGMLAVLAFPSFRRARLRSQRNICMNNMRQIENAKERWALEHNGATGMTVSWSDILPYLKKQPACPAGGTYDEWDIGAPVYCTVHDWRNNPDYAGFEP